MIMTYDFMFLVRFFVKKPFICGIHLNMLWSSFISIASMFSQTASVQILKNVGKLVHVHALWHKQEINCHDITIQPLV